MVVMKKNFSGLLDFMTTMTPQATCLLRRILSFLQCRRAGLCYSKSQVGALSASGFDFNQVAHTSPKMVFPSELVFVQLQCEMLCSSILPRARVGHFHAIPTAYLNVQDPSLAIWSIEA